MVSATEWPPRVSQSMNHSSRVGGASTSTDDGATVGPHVVPRLVVATALLVPVPQPLRVILLG